MSHQKKLKPTEQVITGNNLQLGFGLMLAAFLCFASMDTSAKWLVMSALPAIQIAAIRYLGHFLLTLIIYLPQEGRNMVKSKVPGTQILRALFLLGSTSLNFTALQYLPLTTTIAIFFAAPLVVCILSIPVLGEKVGVMRFAAVVVGFLGVMIIVEPWNESFDYHVLYAVSAMLFASSYFVLTRKVAGVDGNAVSQCYTSGLATLFLLPFAMTLWVWPESAQQWILLALLGTLGMVGHTLVTKAHHYAEASVLAPTVYSQILYSVLFGWFIFGTAPAYNTIMGTAVVIASGFFIWYRERTQQRKDSAIATRSGR